jgi:hypothetical protein
LLGIFSPIKAIKYSAFNQISALALHRFNRMTAESQRNVTESAAKEPKSGQPDEARSHVESSQAAKKK